MEGGIINHADEAGVKGMAGSAALSFVQNIMSAKKAGKKLPKALDKLATLAIKAEAQGKDIAGQTIKQKIKDNTPLIVVSTLAAVLLIMYLKE